MTTFEKNTIARVAAKLIGEPNKSLSKGSDVRYGTHGSLSIDTEKETFYDHEAKEGGGIVDLVCRQNDCSRLEAGKWLIEHGYMQDQPAQQPRQVAAYDYNDADGVLQFQVVRYEPKTFKQRKPDGAGWSWSVRGVEQVPYRLPQLLAQPDAVVLVVEGEKDVDRLASIGMVATCNAGGAGKWGATHSKHLQSRDVVVLPDNDDAGRDHAQKVLKSLQGIARSIRVVTLPDVPQKGDVSDWLDAGHGADDLAALIAEDASKYSRKVMLTCGSDMTPEPVVWLWQHWLAQGKLHLLAGTPGQGKTTIAMAVAATVTIGGVWPDGTRCEPGNIVIWSGEDDPADTLLPRLIASGADRSRCFFISGVRCGDEVLAFDPARDMPALEQQCVSLGGVKLIIVDPVVSAVTGDSHKNAEVRRDLQPLVDLTSKIGAAALGITHLSKGGAGSDPASRVIGSIAFTAVARVVLVAGKVLNEDGTFKRILARGKSNIGPDDGGFEYHIDQSEPLPGIQACSVSWGQALDGTARELLQDAEPERSDSDSEDQHDAAQMLQAELVSDCWTPAKKVFKSLMDAGFSRDKVKRASLKIGVLKRKGGMDGGWYWRLPGSISPEDEIHLGDAEGRKNTNEECEGSAFERRAPFAPFGEKVLPSDEMESMVRDFCKSVTTQKPVAEGGHVFEQMETF